MAFLTFLRLQWDRAGAALAVLIGGLALLLGWIGVSGAGLVSQQLPYYLSGGLVGIFFLGIGAVLWLSADLRDEWRELRQLRVLLREVVDGNGGVLIPADVLATLRGAPQVQAAEASDVEQTAPVQPILLESLGDRPSRTPRSRRTAGVR